MRLIEKLSVLIMVLFLSTGAFCAEEQPLQGGVNINMLQVEETLAQMETLEAKINKDSQALAYQLIRQHTEHVASPNFIGSATNQIIIPPVPQPDGSMKAGELKPISKPVFHKLLTDLREQVVEMRRKVVILNNWPTGLDKEVAAPWKQTTTAVEEMVNSCNRLIDAWTKDKTSRTALAKELHVINKRCEQVDKQLDQIVRIVKDYDRNQKAELAGSGARK